MKAPDVGSLLGSTNSPGRDPLRSPSLHLTAARKPASMTSPSRPRAQSLPSTHPLRQRIPLPLEGNWTCRDSQCGAFVRPEDMVHMCPVWGETRGCRVCGTTRRAPWIPCPLWGYSAAPMVLPSPRRLVGRQAERSHAPPVKAPATAAGTHSGQGRTPEPAEAPQTIPQTPAGSAIVAVEPVAVEPAALAMIPQTPLGDSGRRLKLKRKREEHKLKRSGA
jgi:hypothetical protein